MATTEPTGKGHRGSYRDAEGRRHKTPVYSSKRKALEVASDLETKARSGKWIDPAAGRLTFSDYFENQWLPNRVMQIGTSDYYASIYRSTLKEEFGDMELRRILPSTVQGWIARMDKEGVKPSTINAKAKALQTILAGKKGESALSDRLIEFNPCATMMLPTVVEPEVKIFTPDEAGTIFEAMRPWWCDLVVLDAETGLRWGELMGLTVGDFGLNYRTVTVRRTIVETAIERSGNGTRFAWKAMPKSNKSRALRHRPQGRPGRPARGPLSHDARGGFDHGRSTRHGRTRRHRAQEGHQGRPGGPARALCRRARVPRKFGRPSIACTGSDHPGLRAAAERVRVATRPTRLVSTLA